MMEELREDLRTRGLLPHQVDFIETALDSLPLGRVLLADDVGLGKTHACAALIWAWTREMQRLPRTLVLAPRPLLSQWQDRLSTLAQIAFDVVDASRFRHLEAQTAPESNPWESLSAAITTPDFLKRSDRLSQVLSVQWDVVVADEAHAGATTERGQLLRRLWESPNVGLMVAASATPRSEPAEFGSPAGRETIMIRRRPQDLVDWDGRALLGDADARVIEVVRLDLTPEEQHIADEMRRILKSVDGADPRRRFLISTLYRAAASSLFALEGLVRRALSRSAEPSLLRTVSSLSLAADDDLVEGLDVADQTPDYQLSREELERLAELVDAVETDTKWATCAAILQSHFNGVGTPVVVFSDFVDTTRYLASLLSEHGMTVRAISGRTPLAEREEAVRDFQDEGGILVLTSAAAEGLVLATAKLCVHYDLPWNPGVLAQRIGRIHRFGAPPGPVQHVLFADEVLMPDWLVRKSFTFDVDAGDELTPDVLSELQREDE